MATMKMSGCMKLVSRMSQADQDLLLQRLDDYQAGGVPAEVAQNMAARDTLAELQGERTQLEQLLREQHPDLFQMAAAPAATLSTLRQSGASADLFPNEFATKRTTVPTKRIVSSKGDTAKGGNVDSAGNQITATKQGLQNFWNWFGSSEATDARGRPMVLYHSTNADTDVLRPGIESTNNYGILGNVTVTRSGIFLTPSKKFSQEYLRDGAGQNVMPVYAKLENPLDLREGLTANDERALADAGLSTRYVHNVPNHWELFDNADDGTNDFVEGLKRAGYDGAIFSEDSPTGATQGGTTYVVFDSGQIKSAVGNSGAFSTTDNRIQKSTLRNVPDTNAFQAFTEGLPVVEEGADDYEGGGAVFQAYHGTTHPDITVFEETGSPEGFLGVGPYFTTTAADASSNYAGVGPDLTGRIERRYEEILQGMQDDDYNAAGTLRDYYDAHPNVTPVEGWDEDNTQDAVAEHGDAAAKYAATQQLKGQTEGLMMPVFVKLKNPADTTGRSADLTYELVEDENGDIVEEKGTLIDWIEAARRVGESYGADTEPYITSLMEQGGEVGMDEAFNLALKHLSEAYDDEGNLLTGGAVFREIAKEAGYDGVIMDADKHFGNRRGFGGARLPGMAGVDPSTLHIVPFNSTAVKSATGNDGSYDLDDARITSSRQRNISPLGFYSALAESIDGIKTSAAPAAGWKDAIKGLVNKGQVKADELEWSGINEWLDLQQGRVTKEQVQDYLRQGGVQVEETVLGAPMAPGETDRRLEAWAEKNSGPVAEAILNGEPWYKTRRLAEEAGEDAVVRLIDIQANPAKYAKYTLPGGENYREVLLTLPQEGGAVRAADERLRRAMEESRTGTNSEIEQEVRDARKALESARNQQSANTYRSKHWDQSNVLAHIRLNDRTDADGKRVLFVEELQSDWSQDGRKRGFGQKQMQVSPGERSALIERMRKAAEDKMAANGVERDVAQRTVIGLGHDVLASMSGMQDAYNDLLRREQSDRQADPVPRAPFVDVTDKWLALTLKRVITMAAQEGYDRVAFVTGEQSAQRYDLSKHVDQVSYSDDGVLRAFQGRKNVLTQKVEPEKIENYIGKEVAQRLLDAPMEDGRRVLMGESLKVGGEGMRAFYDKIVPAAANKLLAKVGGGKVGTVDVRIGKAADNPEALQFQIDHPEIYSAETRRLAEQELAGARAQQPGFDITPAMREKVEAGVPLFSPRRNIFSQQLPQPLATWTKPTASAFDSFVYKMQDKQIDTKRVVDAIKAAAGKLDDETNAYLQEELYHGRTAKQTKDFLLTELRPLMQDMAARGVDMAELEEYLHNRHAEERNIQIAKINPRFPDGGSGIDTADARSYLAGLAPAKRQAYEALARRVDAINAGTRQLLVASGLETQETIDKWEAAYGKYVPLYREDVDFGDSSGPGTGQGYSVRGPASKRATGSSRPVVDILANIAMQRERTIVRAEKNRVAQAVFGLAVKAPNTEFWLAVDPAGQKDPNVAMADLMAMGIDPADAKNIIEEPTQAHVDARTGLVSYRINPRLRGSDHVLAMRIDGRDKFVFFNNNDPRGKRMAEALKNLDADQLGQLMSMSAKVTRYFAAVNTQYNPIFGVVNMLRDVQGAMFNLSTTPLAGDKAKVMGGVRQALMGIYADLRAERRGTPNNKPPGSYAQLWEEFQREGGQTGFRAMFSQSQERAEALQRELDPSSWSSTRLGKVFTAGGRLTMPLEAARKYAWAPVFDWLSDFNETIENAVRLSAYKVAKDKGLSAQQAASIAKNLTVNFNRKGQIGTQAGALYAFFNASVQGTARLGQLMFDMPRPGDPKSIRLSGVGQKILAGGLLLGTVQALMLAAAGFDEDEPPDFVKERNLIIPLGGGKYVQVPMPLGLNVIPNVSRNVTEYFLNGRRDPAKYLGRITGALFEMFNPIGSAGWSIQTLTPTVLDPLAALSENKDYTGKPIAKKDMNENDPTPGFTRAKETASALSKFVAKYLNLVSGGTMYKPGVISPTPDQLDYLIGQVTGGVGRELMKVEQSVTSQVTGEELPPHKIPWAGRFYGDTAAGSSEANRFYENVRRLNEHENEIKGRQKDRKPVQDYLQTYPEARLVQQANSIERQVSDLRKRKRELLERDASKESIKLVETRINARMKQLNDAVKRQRERETVQ